MPLKLVSSTLNYGTVKVGVFPRKKGGHSPLMIAGELVKNIVENKTKILL